MWPAEFIIAIVPQRTSQEVANACTAIRNTSSIDHVTLRAI